MKNKILKAVPIGLCSILGVLTLNVNSPTVSQNKPIEQKSSIAYIDLEDLSKSSEFKEKMNINHKEIFGENYVEILSKNVQSTNAAEKIEKMFITKSNEKVYPNYYGGTYINSDGDLIIQVTKESKNIKKLATDTKYNTYINSVDNTKIEYVDHSFNDLDRVNNTIINYFTNNGITINGFIGNYVDVISNSVVVELKNNTIEEQNDYLL